MRKKFKYLLILFVLCLGINSMEVSAVSMKKGDHYTYSSCGLSGEGAKWDYTVYKSIGGDDAYCIEEKVKACTSVSVANDKRHSDPAKLFAGLAWDKVKASVTDDYSSSCKVAKRRYVYMFMLLNSYYRKDPDNINSKYRSSSVDFTKGKKNEDIKKLYNEIMAEKKEITSASLNKGTFSADMTLTSLNKSTTTYISKAVSISDLSVDVMGQTPTYTLKLTATGDATPTICSKANGTSCSGDTATISGNSNYNFYIRVDNATADTVITANIKGNVCRSYSKMTYYYKGGGCQDVARNVGGTSETCKTSNNSKKFAIKPRTENYSISLYKYDDEGNNVDDAEFTMTVNNSTIELTKDGHHFYNNNLTTPLASARVCYTETAVPSGFVAPTENPNCFDVPAEGSSICYDSEGNPQDSQFCDAYKYMCKDDTAEGGYKDPNDEGKCMYDHSETAGKVCWSVEPDLGIPLNEEDATKCDAPDASTVPDDAGNVYKYYCTSDLNTPVAADATCPATVTTSEDPTKKECVVSNGNGGYTPGDGQYCGVDHSTYTKVDFNSNTLVLSTINNKNTVSISKKAITGDDEVPGANLKICTKDDYDSGNINCTAAKSIDGKDLEWTSDFEPKIINGIPKGDYYIVETLPPAGYKLATTATSFSINNDGKVIVGEQEADGPIVVHDSLNEVVISKTDMASTKELPGAKLSICLTTFGRTDGITPEETTEGDEGDEGDSIDDGGGEGLLSDVDGNCIPALDAEGNEISWISGDTPHKVYGLPAGTYYLVETTAPDGYTTAESIQFTMNADGTLTDKNGKSLADNKLVMKDATIQQVKTGRAIMVIAMIVGILAVGLGSYYAVGRKKLFAGGDGVMLHSRAKLRRKK